MLRRFLALVLCLIGWASAPKLALPAPFDALEARPTNLAPGAQRLGLSRDVIPALTKAGCNSGACHGSFQGRGGLRLSLLGFDPAHDFEALTKASRGRRICSRHWGEFRTGAGGGWRRTPRPRRCFALGFPQERVVRKLTNWLDCRSPSMRRASCSRPANPGSRCNYK